MTVVPHICVTVLNSFYMYVSFLITDTFMFGLYFHFIYEETEMGNLNYLSIYTELEKEEAVFQPRVYASGTLSSKLVPF